MLSGGLPHRGGDTASFRQCLKGIKDGQAADGGAYLPVQAKGPEQMLGTAAWLRCLTYDAPAGGGCKPLNHGLPVFGRFLLKHAKHVQFHAEIAGLSGASGAFARQRRHIAVTRLAPDSPGGCVNGCTA